MGGLRMDEICNMRVKSENDNLIMLFTCYNYKLLNMYVGLILLCLCVLESTNNNSIYCKNDRL